CCSHNLMSPHYIFTVVCSCMFPPPPSSTLFPYTTLFRSSFIFFDYYISPEPDTDILHHLMLHCFISFWIFKQASDLLCSSFVIPHFDYMTGFTIPDNFRNAAGR